MTETTSTDDLTTKTAELHRQLAELWGVELSHVSISVYGVGTERFDAAPGDAGKYEDDITGPYCTKDLLPVEISPPMDDIPGLKVSTVTLYCDHDHEDLDT